MSQIGANNSNWKGGLIKRVCQVCGNSFEVKVNVVRKGSGNFCLRSCARISYSKKASKLALQKRIIKHCIVCSEEIRLKPSHAKKRGKYCSYNCMGVDYRKRLTQEKNPNYKHGEAGTKKYEKMMSKKWRGNNKEKVSVTNRNTKARRKKAKGKHEKTDIDFLFEFQKKRCAICKNNLDKGCHVDHIQPISLGGANYKTNLQLLCPSCNLQKGAKDPIIFMQSKGFLL